MTCAMVCGAIVVVYMCAGERRTVNRIIPPTFNKMSS